MASIPYMQNLTSRSTYKETVSTVSSKGQVTLPKEIYSYDHGFDKIKGIIRKEPQH